MATKKTIQLEVDTNAQDAQKKFDSLREQIKRAKEEVQAFEDANVSNTREARDAALQLEQLEQSYKDLNKSSTDLGATFEDVYGEVKPLTAQMGEMEDRLYQMALAGDTASKEYHDLLTEVGKYRKIQMDTDMVTDAAATTMSQKLGGAIQGAASGFAVAQGTMALFGTESEELEETLIKLNAAMAISQGIQGLREGAKSFQTMGMAAQKALAGIKTGVAATGIGVLLIALGAVAAYWDEITALVSKYTSEVEDAAEAQEKLNTQNERDLAHIMKLDSESVTVINRKKNIIKNEEKIKDLQAEGIGNELKINKLRKENLKMEISNLMRLEGSAKKYMTAQQRVALEGETFRKEQELARMDIIALAEEEQKLEDQREKNAAKREARRAKRAERRAFNLQIERELEDLKISQLKDGYDKEVILINTQHKRIREDTLANVKLTEQQKTDLLVEQEEIRQGKLIALGDRRGEVEFTKMETRNATEISMTKELLEHKDNLEHQFYLRAVARDSKRKEQAKETAQAMANIAIDGLRLVSDIADLMAKGDKRKQKRAFNIKKAADIAEATMSGYKAVITTFANAPGGLALKAIQAGIAGAFSAVQIAKIASAKFESGQAPSDLADAPSDGGGGAASAPSFNVVGDSGMNQLAQLQMQPTQAYVVSGDITTAQSLDRNKIENATI